MEWEKGGWGNGYMLRQIGLLYTLRSPLNPYFREQPNSGRSTTHTAHTPVASFGGHSHQAATVPLFLLPTNLGGR